MTNEEINVTIALERGYINPRYEDGFERASLGEKPDGSGFWGLRGFPDYCNDLKAIHKVLLTLKGWHPRKFVENLMDVCGAHPIGCVPEWDTDRQSLFILITAKPRKLAEAYLKALKLWKE